MKRLLTSSGALLAAALLILALPAGRVVLPALPPSLSESSLAFPLLLLAPGLRP